MTDINRYKGRIDVPDTEKPKKVYFASKWPLVNKKPEASNKLDPTKRVRSPSSDKP
ncbi:MAG: hypothetical protein HQM16_07470 [Deltaproteobacteria bacterium]|nr:hypothetical protein [Deltaproteobacteria bacterium]